MKATHFTWALFTVLLLTAAQPSAQTFKVIYNFTDNPDGANPSAGLVIGGSALYGTTYTGGSASNGTVFKVNTDGTDYAVLKSFPALSESYPYTNNNGAWPSAGLALADDTLYGTTQNGGSLGGGTVYRVNTNGSGYVVLKNFSRPDINNLNNDGAHPHAGLALSGDTLYGTTYGGGTNGTGTVFKVNTNGSGFTVLKYFSGNAVDPYTPSDGAIPIAGLLSDGNTLYGTTHAGGAFGHGTVFTVNTDGSGYTVLKSFPRFPPRPRHEH